VALVAGLALAPAAQPRADTTATRITITIVVATPQVRRS